MAEPLSWQLIEKLCLWIGQATVANGYYLDWVAQSEEYQVNEPQDLFPVAFVAEDDDTTDKTFSSGDTSTINIKIEAFILTDLENAQRKAHQARADLVRCIPRSIRSNSEFWRLPVGVHSLEFDSKRIIQPADGVPFVTVQVRLRAGLQESSVKPA